MKSIKTIGVGVDIIVCCISDPGGPGNHDRDNLEAQVITVALAKKYNCALLLLGETASEGIPRCREPVK